MMKRYILSIIFLACILGAYGVDNEDIYQISAFEMDALRVYSLPFPALLQVPAVGVFMTMNTFRAILPQSIERIDQILMPEIERFNLELGKYKTKLAQSKFWSGFWFITACIAGALVLGAAIYIGVDLGIIHKSLDTGLRF